MRKTISKYIHAVFLRSTRIISDSLLFAIYRTIKHVRPRNEISSVERRSRIYAMKEKEKGTEREREREREREKEK